MTLPITSLLDVTNTKSKEDSYMDDNERMLWDEVESHLADPEIGQAILDEVKENLRRDLTGQGPRFLVEGLSNTLTNAITEMVVQEYGDFSDPPYAMTEEIQSTLEVLAENFISCVDEDKRLQFAAMYIVGMFMAQLSYRGVIIHHGEAV